MSTFKTSLARLHRLRTIGRLLSILLLIITLLGIALLAHGLADYTLALSPETRQAVNLFTAATCAAIALIFIIRILRTPASESARLADSALSDSRHRSLAASNLVDRKPTTEMEEFHRQRTLTDAESNLKTLPFKIRLPLKTLGIASLALLAFATALFTLNFRAPEAFEVVSERILKPNSGRAPYSPLRFTVTPETPRTIYGDEAVVEVTITGGKIENDVLCLIRDPATGKIEELTTFQQQPGHYARKFENNQANLEFAFATGRARSDWHQLEVVFQPRVSNASVTVTPPAYTGQPTREYPLDSGEIKALEGSEIQLTLESNRPLASGSLKIHGLEQAEESTPEIVTADLTGKNSLTYRFTAHRSARLAASIRDIRSTPAETPFQLNLKTIPDQAPLVTLTEPQALVLATPRSIVPIRGDVEDDHGLAKVSFTRSLLGYRDRNRLLADALQAKDFDFEDSLQLEQLGVEPGETLEFFLEAADRNPSLLGIGVSNVIKILIISEEEYASRIRANFDLKNFTDRYRALADAVAKSRKALEELRDITEGSDLEAFEKTLEDAKKAHRESAEMADKIAKDFQAFDLEGRLRDAAEELKKNLAENQKDLRNLDPGKSRAELDQKIREMQKRLGASEKSTAELLAQAELAQKAGEVLKFAAEYKNIIAAQESIVDRLQEVIKGLARGETAMAQRLEGLASVQKLNRETLQKFIIDLRAAAEKLPPELETMHQDVKDFLEVLEAFDIPSPMDAASAEALAGKSSESFNQAAMALRLLKQVLDELAGNSFCQACQGQSQPRFQVKPDVAQTMQQMLEALMAQAGPQGQGAGQNGLGGGPGGGGQDGFSVPGNSGIPAYGPDRLQFSTPQLAGRGGNSGPNGKGTGNSEKPPVANTLAPDEFRDPAEASIIPENVPDKYREAVKRYFITPENP